MKKICSICDNEKPVEEFYKRKDSKDGYRNDCIECHLDKKRIYSKENSQHKRDYMRQYRIDNPEVIKIWINNNREQYLWNSKKWKMDNPEKSKEHKNNNRKNRLHNDPQYRLKNNIRRLILLSFSKKGYSKKSKTNQILGIDYGGFMKHIESKFTEGMTWKNRGEWELDHIIPVSLGKSEEEIIRLNHYSNFRPLWRKDNLLKSNTILEEYKHLVGNYVLL
jgi:hypothetical protein